MGKKGGGVGLGLLVLLLLTLSSFPSPSIHVSPLEAALVWPRKAAGSVSWSQLETSDEFASRRRRVPQRLFVAVAERFTGISDAIRDHWLPYFF